MTHGRSCSLLLYQHSYAQRSAPLSWHSTPRAEKRTQRSEQRIARRDTADTTRTFSVSRFEFLFSLICLEINNPWSRKKDFRRNSKENIENEMAFEEVIKSGEKEISFFCVNYYLKTRWLRFYLSYLGGNLSKFIHYSHYLKH